MKISKSTQTVPLFLFLPFLKSLLPLYNIASSLCTNCGYSQTKYNINQSRTYAKDGRAWSISYGDGFSASGTLGTDAIVLGGLTIQRQTLELARHESSSFQNGPSDGLLGFGFNSITTESNSSGGEYILGEYNSSKFKGSLATIPVDNSNGWYGVAVPVAGSFDAILVTSTSLLIPRNNVVRSVASAYGARDNYDGTFSTGCDTSGFQPLVFTIGSSTFEVPAGSLVYEQYGYSSVTSFSYGDYDFATFDDVLQSNYSVFNLVASINVLLDE
ncbi:hypothetical protein G6F43_009455 [Rhizopus delemar]|nr:hypothetical protein G6F43_009455 [Rhizopus delemar]